MCVHGHGEGYDDICSDRLSVCQCYAMQIGIRTEKRQKAKEGNIGAGTRDLGHKYTVCGLI